MPHIMTYSGIEWHYEIEGEGEDLLFIHGWGVDKRIWRQQSKYFSQRYRVTAIDLPGHGKSNWHKVNLTDMANDISYVLWKLDIERVTTIGSSLGGLIALKLYEVRPQIIQRMIFVGAMPKFSKSKDYPYGLDIKKMKKLGNQLETAYPSIVNVFFRSLFTKEERQTRRFKWLQKFRQTDEMPQREALINYLDILEHADLRDVLKKVPVPIQFINGTQDEICPQQAVDVMRKLSARSRFDHFEKCGHFPFLSKPYEFNALMEDFLTQTGSNNGA